MSRSMWLLLGLAACGDDSNRRISDGPPGHEIDAAVIDAAPAPVTVTMRDGRQDIHVYFQNADSTLVASKATDANGNASAVMAAGGFATAVVTPPQPAGAAQYTLYTFAGVKPGDHLFVPSNAIAMAIPVTFTLPVQAGAVRYDVDTTCGQATVSPPTGSGAAATFDILATLYDCNGTADVLVVALDSDLLPLSSMSIVAQPVNSGDTIDYTAKTYTAATTRTYQLDNNPDPNTAIFLTDLYFTSRGALFSGPQLGAGGSPAMWTSALPAAPQGTLDVVTFEQTEALSTRRFAEWGTTGNYVQDWGAHLLPDFTDGPVFDPATHSIGWGATGGTLVPDLELGYFHVNAGKASPPSWDWYIAGPSAATVGIPAVPTDIADFNPTANDSVFVNEWQLAKVPGGYDAFRGHVFDGGLPVLGATGTASVSSYHPPLTVTARTRR